MMPAPGACIFMCGGIYVRRDESAPREIGTPWPRKFVYCGRTQWNGLPGRERVPLNLDKLTSSRGAYPIAFASIVVDTWVIFCCHG